MLTKTRNIKKKENDLDTNHSFSIPKNIQKNINERGFYLYEWIGNNDIKQSIQRDFLKLLNKVGIIGAFIIIIPTVFLMYIESPFAYTFFFLTLSAINILFLIYLTFISIKRSSILRKNAYILITDKAVSINGKIKQIKENKIYSNSSLQKISKLFEEELFKESKISKTKEGFKKQLTEKIGNGYKRIFSMYSSSNSRNNGGGIILLLIFYTIYIVSVSFIYFLGTIFISFFSILLSIINKKILLISGHKITNINNKFENIDKYSKLLIKEKNNLSNLLKNAIKNNWEDSLLTKINKGIKNINNNASNSVNTSIKLKEEITSSKYKEMFNFSIYNSWIKKQIYTPLKQILELLENNLNKLKENEKNIEKQILETTNESFKGTLIVSKARTIMQIQNIEKHIKGIKIYIDKLK